MTKKVLESFDEKQAEKSDNKQTVVEPKTTVAKSEDEAKSAPISVPSETKVGQKATAGKDVKPDADEAKKDADESADVNVNPKPFEKDGKVEDNENHANGGDYAELSKLTQLLTTNFGGVQKGLEENQSAVNSLKDTVAGVTAQLDEIRTLVVEGFAQKADDPKTPAEAKEDIKENTEKSDNPNGEDADDEDDKSCAPDAKAQKADKSKTAVKDDDDEDDDEEASDKKGAEAKPAKKEAHKSLEANDAVAEPVDDEPLYVAKKSAAEGSVAEPAEKAEDKHDVKPKKAEKSLKDQFIAAQYAVGDFNDKLVKEAQAGRLTRPEYMEKSMLAQDIAYGRNITQEKLDKFTNFIKK